MGSGTMKAYLLGSALPFPHRVVAGFVALHIPDEHPDREAWVSNETLSELTGKFDSRIRESLKAAEAAGELGVEHRPGTTSRRWVRWDALQWPWREDLSTPTGRIVAGLVGIRIEDLPKKPRTRAERKRARSRPDRRAITPAHPSVPAGSGTRGTRATSPALNPREPPVNLGSLGWFPLERSPQAPRPVTRGRWSNRNSRITS